MNLYINLNPWHTASPDLVTLQKTRVMPAEEFRYIPAVLTAGMTLQRLSQTQANWASESYVAAFLKPRERFSNRRNAIGGFFEIFSFPALTTAAMCMLF